MQTFLPYKSFTRTAQVLDQKRLGKQRIEAFMILEILEGKKSVWKNHPAVRMWSGYNNALILYYNIILEEWEKRGFKNNMPYLKIYSKIIDPPWLSDPRLPLSHRGNLLRKDPEYYSKFGWPEADPACPYFWPVELLTPANQKIMSGYWGKILEVN